MSERAEIGMDELGLIAAAIAIGNLDPVRSSVIQLSKVLRQREAARIAALPPVADGDE
jgi:hypothetical protein